MRQLHTKTCFALAVVLFAFASVCGPSANAQNASDSAPVVLVCEHGSVKSLIAASLFNASARERGLPFRAIARGVTPDLSVPTAIAAALKREGFDVRRFKPSMVSKSDVAHAAHVVAIGVDLSAVASGPAVSMERWDDVPAASVDYSAAHASLKQHVDTLLNRLQSQAHE
jgi:protein-tyrosine-phosphatase